MPWVRGCCENTGAEHEYMNMPPPQLSIFRCPCSIQHSSGFHTKNNMLQALYVYRSRYGYMYNYAVFNMNICGTQVTGQ